MEAKALQDIFIKILCSELTGTGLDNSVKKQLTSDTVLSLYSLAEHHDMAHIVFSFLHKYGLQSDDAAYSKFNQKAIMSVYRSEQIKYAYEQICNVFAKAAIPYISLKGLVIRPHYPQESMRTSCDIDILIKEENLNAAVNVLVKNGFKYINKNYHDVLLISPAGVHLELHFNIRENIDNLDSILKDAWQYTKQAEDSRYEFTDEFFVFYMFAHMSYHFLSGGCGIKALMDIWVMKHKMGLTYECAGSLLEKSGIYRFAVEISKLSEICFSGTPKDEYSDMILYYILNGGVYGTEQNKTAVKKSKTKNTLFYLFQRLFLPYKTMVNLYPILKKAPFLLTFCWVLRLFAMLFGNKSKRTFKKIKIAKDVTESKINSITQMREYLEL